MSVSFWIPKSACAGIDDGLFSRSALAQFKSDVVHRSSPQYEVTEDDKQYQLAIDVPGVKLEDMKVELEGDGRVLHVSGSRKTKKGNSVQGYKFDRHFALDKRVETSKITAHLSEGVLVLSAPKKVPPAKHEISIVQGDAPALMDLEEKQEG